MSRRVRIGQLSVDSVSFADALERIAALVERGTGGAIFTPNVDHVVKAETDPAFRRAYERADLCLADGTWIVWASRLLGSPLPAKVSGSDLIVPLARYAGQHGWRLSIVGGAPGVAEAAGARMAREFDVAFVGCDAPAVDMDGSMTAPEETLGRLRAARPDIVLVALGAPKQELWIDRYAERLSPAVAIGIGGSIDFFVGRVRRAPPWVSRMGLEWLYRLAREPRRMWRRYLVEDPRFLTIVARDLRAARHQARP
jgi:N-acetylglucosaminyldiphosphoundecaprenol N-acetyl-beta-D-mannosaminyltransferase